MSITNYILLTDITEKFPNSKVNIKADQDTIMVGLNIRINQLSGGFILKNISTIKVNEEDWTDLLGIALLYWKWANAIGADSLTRGSGSFGLGSESLSSFAPEEPDYLVKSILHALQQKGWAVIRSTYELNDECYDSQLGLGDLRAVASATGAALPSNVVFRNSIISSDDSIVIIPQDEPYAVDLQISLDSGTILNVGSLVSGDNTISITNKTILGGPPTLDLSVDTSYVSLWINVGDLVYLLIPRDIDLKSKKLLNVLAGILPTDGINKTQLDAVDSKVDINSLNINSIEELLGTTLVVATPIPEDSSSTNTIKRWKYAGIADFSTVIKTKYGIIFQYTDDSLSPTIELEIGQTITHQSFNETVQWTVDTTAGNEWIQAETTSGNYPPTLTLTLFSCVKAGATATGTVGLSKLMNNISPLNAVNTAINMNKFGLKQITEITYFSHNIEKVFLDTSCEGISLGNNNDETTMQGKVWFVRLILNF